MLDQIKAAHKKVKVVQAKHSKLGAYDTEPDYVYHRTVAEAFAGQKSEPRDASAWELYSSKPGADEAADELNKAVEELVDLILASSLADQPAIREWARATYWRVTIP